MWWFKNRAPKPEKPLRRQLLDARDALVDQIAVLEGGPAALGKSMAGGYMQDQAAELRRTLSEIEEQLRELKP
jgi:hypothetical protein